jgi:hypothetical protein
MQPGLALKIAIAHGVQHAARARRLRRLRLPSPVELRPAAGMFSYPIRTIAAPEQRMIDSWLQVHRKAS